MIKAVIFDLGGVVLGSPLHAIAAFERELGIAEGFVNRHVAGSAPDGAWHRLERGELRLGEEFFQAFDRELEAAGQALSSREMMARIAQVTEPRTEMLTAIDRLRAADLGVAALTNNWVSQDDQHRAQEGGMRNRELRHRFDHFVESSVVGLRKPDPKIYHLTCELLAVEPEHAAFLDDIGSNLKSARALGMHTIKVDEPISALRELEAATGLELL